MGRGWEIERREKVEEREREGAGWEMERGERKMGIETERDGGEQGEKERLSEREGNTNRKKREKREIRVIE